MALTFLECSLPNCKPVESKHSKKVVRRDQKKSQPNCSIEVKASKSCSVEQTVVMAKFSGELVMECLGCGFITKGYKRDQVRQRMENHNPEV